LIRYRNQQRRSRSPVMDYGAYKYSAEQVLQVAARQGLRTVSFRMFSVYGPGQNLANMKQGMVSIYLAYLLKQEPLIVKGSLERVPNAVEQGGFRYEAAAQENTYRTTV